MRRALFALSAVAALAFALSLPALADPGQAIGPGCGPGRTCTVRNLRLTSDAGVTFSDGTTLNTAATGGTSYGAYASRPTAGSAGRVYVATDAPVSLWVDSGSAWRPLIWGQVLGVQPPAASAFTAVNGAAGTVLSDRNGALHYHRPADASVNAFRGYVQSNTATTAYVEAAIVSNWPNVTGNGFPAQLTVMRESATGKMLSLSVVNYSQAGTSSLYLEEGVWASNTNRTTSTAFSAYLSGPTFIRLRRDASNVYVDISNDRQNWINLKTRTLTSVFTTAPDQVGFGGAQWNGTENIAFDVVHYVSGS